MKRLLLLLVLVFVGLLFTGKVSAVGSDQKKVMQSGVYYFNTAIDQSCFTSGGGSGPITGPAFPQITDLNALVGRIKDYIAKAEPTSQMVNNAEDIVMLGKQYNVNPALLVAVAQKESQFGTDGGIGNPPKHNFWGARAGKSGWQSFASYRDSIEAYYKNLRNHSAYAKVWAKGDAATVDDIIYIASPPSENATASYVQFVHSVIDKLLGADASSAGASTSTSIGGQQSCGSGASGIISAEGYAFPVAPQTKSANTGLSALSAIPCNNTTCHHDNTPAFDIGKQPGGDASAGTAVFAISDGQIDRVKIYKGIDGCYAMQLHSSKDNFWYWYGHLGNPSVTDGQVVKAGQQIAEIGLRKCTANGSDPHLHIDRGCVRNGVPQKGGLDSCRDPGMIPLINKLFEEMPN